MTHQPAATNSASSASICVHLRLCLSLLIFAAPCFAAEGITRSALLPAATPWDLAELSHAPAYRWIDHHGPVRSLTYQGPMHNGQVSEVFAWYATPKTLGMAHEIDAGGRPSFPAVVLVHGGGGTAFAEWAEMWARRGYAAIAMDLAGHRPNETGDPHNRANRTRLERGGPGQEVADKFDTIKTDDLTDDWPYHAIANVILAHSLIRSFPEVDGGRTAVTGISWGGYTTCMVASIDDRFNAAVPVYGCGFLDHNSVWLNQFEKLGPALTRKWVEMYDPSSYLAACRVPILFMNGTNDQAYPLDSYVKSYDLVKDVDKAIRIEPNMRHSHRDGWKPPEVAMWIDRYLRGDKRLPEIDGLDIDGNEVHAKIDFDDLAVTKAALHYATAAAAEPINKLTWQTIEFAPAPAPGPASGDQLKVNAEEEEATLDFTLPAEGKVWFITITDVRDAMISSVPVIAPGN